MSTQKLLAATLFAATLPLLSSAALADATIDGEVRAAVSKGKKFEVVADVTMSDTGTVTLAGTVGGEPFSQTKKFKTKAGRSKSKTIKFSVDPKKLGIRDAADTIVLQAQVSAAEEGQAEPAGAVTGAALPPPLLIVPGTGNETARGAYDPFRDALDENAGSPWLTRGKRASIRVEHYFSLSIGTKSVSLESLGGQVAKSADKMIKKSLFSRCDIVSHSLGGIVVRQAMVPPDGGGVGKKSGPVSLAGRVRHVFFMGTAQSGTPVAYLAESAIRAADLAGVDPLVLAGPLLATVDNPIAEDLGTILLNKNFLGTVRTFLPTYAFADIPFGNSTARVDLPALSQGTDVSPLVALNAVDPDPDATYHALHYTDVAGVSGEVRTVEFVDLVAFLAGGGTDLTKIELLNGDGDGLAPVSSVLMESHENWAPRLNPVPLGPGLHTSPLANPNDPRPAYYNDPQTLDYILQTILQGLPQNT